MRANVAAPCERRKSISPGCLDCDPASRCCLSRCAWFQEMRTIRVLGRNSTLFTQGQPPTRVYALRRGWLKATHVLSNGKGISDLIGPGAVFGIQSAFAASPYHFTTVAIEECEVEEADAVEFLKKLHADPHLAFDVLREVSRSTQRLLDLFYGSAAKVSSYERLIGMFDRISAHCSTEIEGGVRINLPLSVQVMADHIGCSRQWVSKMLSDLQKEGRVKRRGIWLTYSPTASFARDDRSPIAK